MEEQELISRSQDGDLDSFNRLVEDYQGLLHTYRRNLLEIEKAMARFLDQRSVPPDLLRARELAWEKIAELEQTYGVR